ncbi:MAG: DUF421 domain-containing protein [Oscillospiraceae bacterium]|nr:DUF421 domain-containing protein [Oscillospiraceae bacterium]
MEPSEFVVSILLANLATIPVEDTSVSIFHGIIPIALVFVGERVIAYLSLRSIRIRRFFCGKPVILMENGKILAKNLRRTRINLDELTMHLREKDIFDLSTVKFAILETNGQLSTLLYAKDSPPNARDMQVKVEENQLPVTLISDRKIMEENLHLVGKDKNWIYSKLKERGCTLDQTLLLTLDPSGKIYFIEEEKP